LRRREFITLLGGAAAAWPLAARAQQPALPVIGWFGGGSPEPDRVRAFRQGLLELGYVEGQNLTVDYRWANNQQDQLQGIAGDLVRRPVTVIAANNSLAALAAKAASATIPIVFSVGADPVQMGLVASISRPGANVTGVYYITGALGEKRLGLVRELVPAATFVAMLLNPDNPPVADLTTKEVQAAAAVMGLRIGVFRATNNGGIDVAFERLVSAGARALLVSPDPLFTNRRVQIVTLAARHALPAIYTSREYADVGGLMTYGTSLAEVAHQVGNYTGRILKGAKPADLPVLQPTKFELVINLQTAKTLGLTIPPGVLAIADEVIE
jgi:putative ABC transport system substrate-binding protein